MVYWADQPADGSTVEDEYYKKIKVVHENAGLRINNVECVILPPLVGSKHERYYNLLLFDWGGMSLGNSCLQHFSRQIVKESEDYPNRCDVMVSAFTADAMKDVIAEIPNELHNVFLTFESFVEYLGNVEKNKKGADGNGKSLRRGTTPNKKQSRRFQSRPG